MPEGDRQLPDWDEVDRLAEEFGDSFYVHHEAQLRANVTEFQAEFGGRYPATDLAYPYKTNHLPDLCRTMAGLGVRAEIGSDMELWLAHQLGVDRTQLIFNGPNRSKGCLRQVMRDGGTVIVDSLRDLRIVEELARDSPEHEFPLGLRVNFPLGERTRMRLGVDVDSSDFDVAVGPRRPSPGGVALPLSRLERGFLRGTDARSHPRRRADPSRRSGVPGHRGKFLRGCPRCVSRGGRPAAHR
jgi:hypothetical protein